MPLGLDYAKHGWAKRRISLPTKSEDFLRLDYTSTDMIHDCSITQFSNMLMHQVGAVTGGDLIVDVRNTEGDSSIFLNTTYENHLNICPLFRLKH